MRYLMLKSKTPLLQYILSKRTGMTLIEILLSMAVLSSGLVLLMQSWGGNYTRLKKIDRSFEVSAILQRKMVEVDLQYRGKSIDSIPEELSEDIEEAPGFSYTLESKLLKVPDLATIIQASQAETDEQLIVMMRTLTDHLSKTIKEVRVTVSFQPEGVKKPLKYSATTYFVDFDREINFGIGGGAIPAAGGVGP